MPFEEGWRSFHAPRQRAGDTAQGRPGSLARAGSRVRYSKPNQGTFKRKKGAGSLSGYGCWFSIWLRVLVLYLVKGAASLSGSSRNGRRTAQRARAGTASRRLPALRRGRPGRRPAGAPAVIIFVRQTLRNRTASAGRAPGIRTTRTRKCMLSIAWAAQPRRRRRGSRGRRSA